MAICYYICTSCSFVMDFCEHTELGDSWCNERHDYILLVSVNWNIRLCLWRLVSQHMDRFLTSCFSRFTTGIEALTILRCHALVTPCPSLNYFISILFFPPFFFFNILKHFYIHSMLIPFSFLLHFPL